MSGKRYGASRHAFAQYEVDFIIFVLLPPAVEAREFYIWAKADFAGVLDVRSIENTVDNFRRLYGEWRCVDPVQTMREKMPAPTPEAEPPPEPSPEPSPEPPRSPRALPPDLELELVAAEPLMAKRREGVEKAVRRESARIAARCAAWEKIHGPGSVVDKRNFDY